MNRFPNRTEAGKALAHELVVKGYEDPVILALPRGGVASRTRASTSRCGIGSSRRARARPRVVGRSMVKLTP